MEGRQYCLLFTHVFSIYNLVFCFIFYSLPFFSVFLFIIFVIVVIVIVVVVFFFFFFFF